MSPNDAPAASAVPIVVRQREQLVSLIRSFRLHAWCRPDCDSELDPLDPCTCGFVARALDVNELACGMVMT